MRRVGIENPLHIAVLLIVLLLVFGARRLPEMGRSLGAGLREFKDGISGATAPPRLPQAAEAQVAGETAPPAGASPEFPGH